MTAQRPSPASLGRLPSRRTLRVQRTSSAWSTAYQRWGRLDVLFNNAGIAEGRPMLELTRTSGTACWRSICVPSFSCCRRGQRMRHQTPIAGSELRGKLIQTASIAAYRGGQAVHGPLRGQQSRRCQRHAYCGTGAGEPTGSPRIASARVRSTRRCGGRSTPSGARSRAGESVKPGSGEPRLIPLGRPETAGGRGWRR